MDYQILYNLDQQHTSALTPPLAAIALNAMTTEQPRTSITGDELLEGLVLSEGAALSDAGQRALWGLIAKGSISIAAGSNTRTLLMALFPAGSETRGNLIDIATTPLGVDLLGSFGLPHVNGQDVEVARHRYGG